MRPWILSRRDARAYTDTHTCIPGKRNNNAISETSVAEGRFFIVRLNRLSARVSHVSRRIYVSGDRDHRWCSCAAAAVSQNIPRARHSHYNGSQYIWSRDRFLSSECVSRKKSELIPRFRSKIGEKNRQTRYRIYPCPSSS